MTDHTVPLLDSCRWCEVPERDRCQRWHPDAGWHGWTEPTREQRHERMRARFTRPEETSHANQ